MFQSKVEFFLLSHYSKKNHLSKLHRLNTKCKLSAPSRMHERSLHMRETREERERDKRERQERDKREEREKERKQLSTLFLSLSPSLFFIISLPLSLDERAHANDIARHQERVCRLHFRNVAFSSPNLNAGDAKNAMNEP